MSLFFCFKQIPRGFIHSFDAFSDHLQRQQSRKATKSEVCVHTFDWEYLCMYF